MGTEQAKARIIAAGGTVKISPNRTRHYYVIMPSGRQIENASENELIALASSLESENDHANTSQPTPADRS